MKRGIEDESTVMAACMLLVCRADGFALNPSLNVSQYAHASWKNSDGFSEGLIRSIAQTADGYLWLGNRIRLASVRWRAGRRLAAATAGALPSSDTEACKARGDGRLWIGTFSGLASWKDGKTDSLLGIGRADY